MNFNIHNWQTGNSCSGQRSNWQLGVILILLLCPGDVFGFQDNPLIYSKSSKPIRELLTTNWEKTLVVAADSKKTFGDAQNHNVDLLFAYGLNRLRHNRTAEAKLTLEEMTESYPENLDGWMIKTWLDTLTDKFDVALIDMRSLKKQIDKTENISPENMTAIYKRLGRLVGYMQGPVLGRVNDDLLEDTVLKITTGVPDDVLVVFNKNRNKVLKEYDSLLETQGQKTEIELVKVKTQNDAEAISLERQNQLLEQTESRLLPEKQRLRMEANRQALALEQQAQSLAYQIRSISTDVRQTGIDLQYMYSDLFNIQNQPLEYRPSTYYLQNQIRNAEYSLSSLRRNGVDASNQLTSVNFQIARTRNVLNGQLRELEKEIKRANGSKRRNLAKLAKIARGPELANGKRDAMTNRATSLRTYDDLPLVLYRQQLLERLSD